MIFCGDIASPSFQHSLNLSLILKNNKQVFSPQKDLVCNFEGLISDEDLTKSDVPILYNHSSIIKTLEDNGLKVLCFANNHILDIPEKYDDTIKILKDNGIKYCGTGNSKVKADEPIIYKSQGKEITLFNSCWDFLLYNRKNPSNGIYVSTINECELIDNINNIRNKENSVIVVYLHWNLDLETLPFPMHRDFARKLIDAGAKIVIGTHSHCIQGGEKYKDGYIIYGIGNFYIPNNVFVNGKLNYPELSRNQLFFEYDVENEEAYCHWFYYKNNDTEHDLLHLATEKFEESKVLKEYSPYTDLNHEEYIKYYKKYRRKKLLIPVYTDIDKVKTNKVLTFLLKNRARIARKLAQYSLTSWSK